MWGKGYPLHSRLESLGECRKFPEWGSGRTPAENEKVANTNKLRMSNINTKTTIKSKLKPKLKFSKVKFLGFFLKDVKLLKSSPGPRRFGQQLTKQMS